MEVVIMTPESFKEAFPCARSCDEAVEYVIVSHKPTRYISAADIGAEKGQKVVQVGYTNHSRSKRISRFARILED